MMLPGAVTLVPQYLIWQKLGLLGTNVPLWGMNLFGSAFYIFLQRQFFLGLPRELFEAARVDGASYFGLFRRIALPLSIPSFIIVFLFEFQASWNNLQASLIYLNAGSVEDFTVPLGISYAMTKYSPTAGGHGDYQFVMVAVTGRHRAHAGALRLRPALLHRRRGHPRPQGLTPVRSAGLVVRPHRCGLRVLERDVRGLAAEQGRADRVLQLGLDLLTRWRGAEGLALGDDVVVGRDRLVEAGVGAGLHILGRESPGRRPASP